MTKFHRTTRFSSAPTQSRRRGALCRAAYLGAAVLFATVTIAVDGPAAASPASIQQREWWIGRLGLEINDQPAGGAWQITKGAGVTVAVIDEGVDATVPDLSGALLPGFSTVGSASPDVAHDQDGHGTGMATLIAGRGTGPGIIGVAPEAKILPVYSSGDPETDSTIALTRLASMPSPPQIVNMSFGNAGPCPAALQSAVARAVNKGMILVASAGNTGDSGDPTQFPSNCTGVIAAGAFDYNIRPWQSTQRQPYVAIGGPGVDMVAYDRARTLGTSSGTSNASAVVAGELALLRSHWKTMPSRQLVAKLFATTSKLYSGPGYGSSQDLLGYGAGVVNRALRQSVPASAPNAVYDALSKLSTSPASTSPSNNSTQPTTPPGTVGATFPGTGGTPPGTVAANFPGTTSSKSGSNTGAIIGVIVGVLVLLGIIVLVVVLRRRAGPRAGGGYSP